MLQDYKGRMNLRLSSRCLSMVDFMQARVKASARTKRTLQIVLRVSSIWTLNLAMRQTDLNCCELFDIQRK